MICFVLSPPSLPHILQAEAYGFTGSRRFVQDWKDGVKCRNVLDPTLSPSGSEACLDPLYPSLEFQKLGRPAHVVSVDQVHRLAFVLHTFSFLVFFTALYILF